MGNICKSSGELKAIAAREQYAAIDEDIQSQLLKDSKTMIDLHKKIGSGYIDSIFTMTEDEFDGELPGLGQSIWLNKSRNTTPFQQDFQINRTAGDHQTRTFKFQIRSQTDLSNQLRANGSANLQILNASGNLDTVISKAQQKNQQHIVILHIKDGFTEKIKTDTLQLAENARTNSISFSDQYGSHFVGAVHRKAVFFCIASYQGSDEEGLAQMQAQVEAEVTGENSSTGAKYNNWCKCWNNKNSSELRITANVFGVESMTTGEVQTLEDVGTHYGNFLTAIRDQSNITGKYQAEMYPLESIDSIIQLKEMTGDIRDHRILLKYKGLQSTTIALLGKANGLIFGGSFSDFLKGLTIIKYLSANQDTLKYLKLEIEGWEPDNNNINNIVQSITYILEPGRMNYYNQEEKGYLNNICQILNNIDSTGLQALVHRAQNAIKSHRNQQNENKEVFEDLTKYIKSVGSASKFYQREVKELEQLMKKQIGLSNKLNKFKQIVKDQSESTITVLEDSTDASNKKDEDFEQSIKSVNTINENNDEYTQIKEISVQSIHKSSINMNDSDDKKLGKEILKIQSQLQNKQQQIQQLNQKLFRCESRKRLYSDYNKLFERNRINIQLHNKFKKRSTEINALKMKNSGPSLAPNINTIGQSSNFQIRASKQIDQIEQVIIRLQEEKQGINLTIQSIQEQSGQTQEIDTLNNSIATQAIDYCNDEIAKLDKIIIAEIQKLVALKYKKSQSQKSGQQIPISGAGGSGSDDIQNIQQNGIQGNISQNMESQRRSFYGGTEAGGNTSHCGLGLSTSQQSMAHFQGIQQVPQPQLQQQDPATAYKRQTQNNQTQKRCDRF